MALIMIAAILCFSLGLQGTLAQPQRPVLPKSFSFMVSASSTLIIIHIVGAAYSQIFLLITLPLYMQGAAKYLGGNAQGCILFVNVITDKPAYVL